MPDADARLIGAHDLALAALHEITPASTVGPAAGYILEDDGSVSLRFENRLPGYPGWYWTVTVARVDDAEPTVLEAELMPTEGALLAPEWVPWAERLADYRAHQVELAEQAAAVAAEAGEPIAGEASAEEDDDDAEEDDEDEDSDDFDEDDDDDDASEPRTLHAGDLDGVDIDELDESSLDESTNDGESEVAFDDESIGVLDEEAAPEEE